MKDLSKVILKLYKQNPNIVNDDKELIAAIWYEQGWIDNAPLASNLYRVSNPESITRVRRKLHEQGLIQYSPSALKRRTGEFIRYRNENSSYEPPLKFDEEDKAEKELEVKLEQMGLL